MTRRALALAVVVAVGLPLGATGVASAKTTKAFSFQSKGTAAAPGSYEEFPFTIKPSEKNGTINVHIDWLNPADDWDLVVYRRAAGGGQGPTVGQSAGGAPSTEENVASASPGIPWRAGVYVIRVVNFASVVPDFRGTARFGPFIPANQIPIAKLKAPRTAARGQTVTLDASASRDPDGKVVNFAFDLDGNGSMEVRNGKSPFLKRSLPPGTHHVAVRVIDNKGLRAFANRTITVSG